MSRNVLTLSHLYPSPAFPGLGTFVRDEVVELARRNRAAVVAPLPWLPPLLPSNARGVRAVPMRSEEDGIPVVRPRFPGIPIGGRVVEPRLWALRLRPLLRGLYREIEGDLVHAHFALPDGFAAAHFASREGVPLVLTIWGSDVLVFGRRRIMRGHLRQTFDRAQAIIAVSEQLAERAVQVGARSERIRVIPGGVPYRPREPQDQSRAGLGFDQDAVCVLWVGGFVPVKQPLQAVKAFQLFAQESSRTEARLVMIGDGPLMTGVRGYLRRNELQTSVLLLGFCERDEVWRWQCAADVLVNSSRSEGTPLAVLEALGAGTPVAGYSLAGVRAIVDEVDGGSLAAEHTPRALAAAIVKAIAAGRDRDVLAREARERFDIVRAARAIEDVYKAVV